MASFELTFEVDDSGVALVTLAGELDLTNVDDLEEELRAVTEDSPFVLDLNRIVFIDSAALHRLFLIVRERGSRAVAFAIEPTAPIARTLSIVELGRAATLAPTVREAVAALRRTHSD